MIQFCSITTLSTKWRNYIRNKMSWENGGMSYFLRYNLSKHMLALNFKRQQLICWAIIFINGWEEDGRPFLGAWTIKKYRYNGYASKTIGALLSYTGIIITKEINVYQMSMYRLLEKINYTPIYREWNKDKFKIWLEKKSLKCIIYGTE
jgi:hypothetical protein